MALRLRSFASNLASSSFLSAITWSPDLVDRRLSTAAASTSSSVETLLRSRFVPPSPLSINLRGSRGVIAVTGPDSLKFLQGLLTNDMRLLSAPESPTNPTPPSRPLKPLYAFMLDIKGRVTHDVFVHHASSILGDTVPTAAPKHTYFLDIDRAAVPDLVQHLNRIKLRSKLVVADVSESITPFAVYGGQGTSALVPELEGDPRTELLGARGLVAGSDLHSIEALAPVSDAPRYRRWRFLHGVPEGRAEIPPGASMPLEFNLDGLHGVSFSKGCYIGQELTSRTHFTGVIRKRLMPVYIENASALPAEEADREKPAEKDKSLDLGAEGAKSSVGRLVAYDRDGSIGLALVRLEAAGAVAGGQGTVFLQGAPGVRLTPWLPRWWPGGWQMGGLGGAAGEA